MRDGAEVSEHQLLHLLHRHIAAYRHLHAVKLPQLRSDRCLCGVQVQRVQLLVVRAEKPGETTSENNHKSEINGDQKTRACIFLEMFWMSLGKDKLNCTSPAVAACEGVGQALGAGGL